MDTKQAALATKLVNPKIVIPMHYDTFPAIAADANEFEKLVAEKAPDTKVEIVKPGEAKEFNF